VSLKNVSASGGEIKDPVSTPELDLRLTPQSIVSNTFTAKSGSTSLDASFTLTNYDSKDPVADVTLRSSNAQVAELLNIARAYGVAAAEEVTGSGTLSVDVHAHGETSHPELLTYAGTASLQQATVSVPQLTKPVTVHSVNAQFSQNSVALTNLSATVGGSTLSGTLSAANFSAPNLNFALAADKIDTDELQKLMAPTKTKGRVAPVAAGQNEPTLLTVTTGGGTLSVNSIKAQDIVITAVSAKVTLDHGLITLSPLSAAAFNGKINGAVAADMRPKTPLCSLDAKLAGVDANALLSAVSTLKNELYGTLGATTKMKFALASSNDLARTLNGTVDFALSNGELKNVNILGEISKFGKLLGGSSGQGSGGETALKQLSGTMTIADGVATTNNLKAATSDGAVTAKGTLNLVTQAIDMHMTALAIPVLVTGTTAHMKFAPDAKALAKDIPGALEGILGGKNSNGKQTNPLGGILGGFGKKQQ
jgi:AsmA protein